MTAFRTNILLLRTSLELSQEAFGHPSLGAYKRGCRCDDCKRINNESVKKYRAKKKNSIPGCLN